MSLFCSLRSWTNYWCCLIFFSPLDLFSLSFFFRFDVASYALFPTQSRCASDVFFSFRFHSAFQMALSSRSSSESLLLSLVSDSSFTMCFCFQQLPHIQTLPNFVIKAMFRLPKDILTTQSPSSIGGIGIFHGCSTLTPQIPNYPY